LNTHDIKLARKLYSFLKPNDVLLGDRAFCAYADIFPKLISLGGFGVSFSCLFLALGETFDLPEVVNGVAIIGGAIISPFWFIWVGIILRQMSRQ